MKFKIIHPLAVIIPQEGVKEEKNEIEINSNLVKATWILLSIILFNCQPLF